MSPTEPPTESAAESDAGPAGEAASAPVTLVTGGTGTLGRADGRITCDTYLAARTPARKPRITAPGA